MRIYGDGPDASIRRPGHEYAEMVGGLLDGQLLDVTGWSAQQLLGALLICETGMYGPGGRSDYAGRPGEAGRLYWQGDSPWPGPVTADLPRTRGVVSLGWWVV